MIFDEVITGFRLSVAGAAGYFGVQPDLVTYGKIIGAGMPVGAYGGRRGVMERISPLGPVYQAGTLSGNPVAMAAGFAQLKLLRDHPQWYDRLNETAGKFFEEIRSILAAQGLPYPVNHLGEPGLHLLHPGACDQSHPGQDGGYGGLWGHIAGICWTGASIAPPASLRPCSCPRPMGTGS